MYKHEKPILNYSHTYVRIEDATLKAWLLNTSQAKKGRNILKFCFCSSHTHTRG